MSLHVFGIRHHGPGCARSLGNALAALGPDVVLVEGPPDAADVLPLAADPAMRPPVALLVYPPDEPRRAVFYPFARFSPEWLAIRFALERSLPVRFIDLPFAHRAGGTEEAGDDAPIPPRDPEKPDPLSVLAEAAGFADHELWWDAEIERRRDATGVFQGIAEAMAALRSESPGPEGEEALREAWMRQAIRAAAKEGFARIAVVCGAWHAPVLADPGPAKADAALLKGLPKRKVAATWIPWTHARLTFASGYGAGVASPGWYEHLFTAPEKATIRWAAHAARLLREQDLDASSASVIEATRLADALASLREQRSPGLAELDDALLAVLCRGEQAPLALIRNRLAIGDTLGQVPETAPRVPLREDLAAELARLKLKPSTEKKTLDLDLRRDVDRGRSRLLHRLSALGIDWARSQEVRGKAGTFHEVWEVHYRPELEVAIIEASVWGNAVSDAAAARIESAARNAEIATLTPLLDQAILAELPSAASFVLAMLQRSAALSADVPRLMGAIPALARIARYGDVRSTPTEHILPILDGLFARVVIGLPLACASLDDEASRAMAEGLAQVHGAVQLLERAGQRDDWVTVLGKLACGAAQGLVAGFACRLQVELGAVGDDDLETRASLALSPGTPAGEAAAYCEGLLRGSGFLLLGKDGLWRALDNWIRRLDGDTFQEMLPLVRRAFGGFAPPELRAMGEKVKTLGRGLRPVAAAAGDDVDLARAARVLPVLALILGVDPGGVPPEGMS